MGNEKDVWCDGILSDNDSRPYGVQDWGLTGYEKALERQKEEFSRRLAGKGENTLVVTRHEPTITLGKSASEDDILVDKTVLEEHEVKLVEIGRGGGVTYHGPGQLVLYPIFDLRDYDRDLREFIRRLGSVVGRTAEYFGLATEFREGEQIGLWIDGKREKLASIGLRVKRWYTMHGIALNVKLDEEKAGLIRPCGISDTRLASIADFADVGIDGVKEELLSRFQAEFS